MWRQAGMTYVRYANMCASLVRRSLKEPLKGKAMERDAVGMKIAEWEAGRAKKAVEVKIDE